MTWLFIAMALTPLIFAPKIFFNGFGLPQTLALGVLSSLSIVVGLFYGCSLPVGLPTTTLLIFTICVVLALLKSDPIHNGRKEFGLQLTLIMSFFAIVTLLQPSNIKWVALSSTVATGLCCLYAIAQTYEVDPFFPNAIKAGGPITNAIGTIGNPNFLASYICSAVWLTVYSAFSFDTSILVVSFIALFALFRTHSRAGLCGFCGSIWFFVLVCAYYTNALPSWVFHLGIGLSILGLIVLVELFRLNWDTFFYKEIDPKGEQVWYASFRYRLCYWLVALKLFALRPWFGGGLWNFRKDLYRMQGIINEKDPRFLSPTRYLTPQPREVHNDYLEHLVEYGLVGTSIFLIFTGSIYYYGFQYLSLVSGLEFYKMLMLLSGLTAVMVDAIFFFALRLPTTGLMFWMICGFIMLKAGSAKLLTITPNILATVFIAFLLYYFLWECVIKRALTSYHFLKSRALKDNVLRSKHLVMALHYSPNDTILRTHACISCLDHEPTLANAHAWKIVEHYDGMSPLHVSLFNAGLAIAKTRNIYEHAEVFLKNAHYLLPTFKPALDMLNGKNNICSRSTYKGGTASMRISDEGTLWRVRAMLGEIERCNLNQQLHQMKLENMGLVTQNLETTKQLAISNLEHSLVVERKRLNLPDHWPFDPENGQFLDPNEMDATTKTRFGIKEQPKK